MRFVPLHSCTFAVSHTSTPYQRYIPHTFITALRIFRSTPNFLFRCSPSFSLALSLAPRPGRDTCSSRTDGLDRLVGFRSSLCCRELPIRWESVRFRFRAGFLVGLGLTRCIHSLFSKGAALQSDRLSSKILDNAPPMSQYALLLAS